MSTENKKPAADSQGGNSVETRHKGERMVDRHIPIRLYPPNEEPSKTDEEVEELTVISVIDHTVSHNNKTNLRELKFTKIDLLTGNAEAYCRLIKRLKQEKWSREDPSKQSFWKRARDFSDCISTKSKYTFEAALAQLMGRVADIWKNSDLDGNPITESRVTSTELRRSSFWKLQEFYEKVHPKKKGPNYQDRKFWDGCFDDLVEDEDLDPKDEDEEMEDVDEVEEPSYDGTPKVPKRIDGWRKGIFLVWLEREFWEDMARTVFREPHNAYKTQYKYLTGDIQKPFKENFSNYKARVEQVFGYLDEFPAPCWRGTRPDSTNYLEKAETISTETVRLAIFESLPASWRDMYDNREAADCRKLTEAEFMATMIKIEEQEALNRAAIKKKPAAAPAAGKKRGANDGNQSNPGDRKKRAKRFCQKCKDAGRSEKAYTSHDQAYCKASNEARSPKSNDDKAFKPSKKEWKKALMVIEKFSKSSHLESDTDASA